MNRMKHREIDSSKTAEKQEFRAARTSFSLIPSDYARSI
jgi:hypothetical protein